LPGSSARWTSVILYHKPANVVATRAVNDVQGRRNVFEDLMMRASLNTDCTNTNKLPLDFPAEWHTVGRLDADTTGLLLLTNDGGLVHRVTNHKAAVAVASASMASLGKSSRDGGADYALVEKTYEACIMGHYENECDMLQVLRTQGVDIGEKYGGQTLPVKQVQVLGHPNHKSTIVSLTLVEGKNRQVRRMFHALGSGVMQLKRTSIGVGSTLLSLSMLAPNEGDWCFLDDSQVETCLQWTPRRLEPARPNGNTASRPGSSAVSKQQ
jgi:pseudouridine synthase